MQSRALNGKNALVTGASRGIGRAVARHLGELGASVAVNYHRSPDAAEEVCAEIRAGGGRAEALQADLADIGQIEQLFERTAELFGDLHILVNNAGMAIYRPVAEITEDDYERLFALNVKGVLFACQQASRRMADGGRIVNISTTVTRMMLPRYALYAASKAAVDQVTRVLAKELGVRGITVNSLSPGPTDTELFRTGKTDEQIAQMAAMSPFQRLGTPEDIAAAVGLLVTDAAGWISGQDICANGALTG